MYFYPLALGILIVDQFIKTLIDMFMQLNQSLPFIGNIIKLTYVRNTGAAFSLFVGFSPYLIAVGLAVALVVIYFHHAKIAKDDHLLQLALAFILGGSLGNLVDRIVRGYVVDYIDFGFWPVFNFADIMINVGVIIFLLFIFREEKDELKEICADNECCEEIKHAPDID